MSEWIEYDGKGQPVPDHVLIEALFDDGSGDVDVAGTWCWDEHIAPIKYRIVGREQPETKGTNPKAAIGASKLPLHLASPLAVAYMSVALANGASKYGIANYKGTEVQASIYLSALLRHFMAFLEGEEYDPVDGQPHLGGILANVAIILDARAAGTLIDDRPIAGGYLKELETLTEIYQNIVKLHEGKNPHHYTLNNEEK